MADPNNIVLPAQRLVFMLPRRVASTSIRAALLRSQGRSDAAPHNPGHFMHQPAGVCLRLRDDHGFLVVAPVRHPVPRLVSCWRGKVAVNLHEGLARRHLWAWEGMPLVEFVRHVLRTSDEEADQHFRSQAWDLMHHHELVPNWLIDFDELAVGWGKVQRWVMRSGGRLGPLRWEGASGSVPEAEPLPEDMYQAVRDRFARDVVLYHRRLGPPSLAVRKHWLAEFET